MHDTNPNGIPSPFCVSAHSLSFLFLLSDGFRQRLEDPLTSGLMSKAEAELEMDGQQQKKEEERLVLKAHLRGPQLNASDPNQVLKVDLSHYTAKRLFSKCCNPMKKTLMETKWNFSTAFPRRKESCCYRTSRKKIRRRKRKEREAKIVSMERGRKGNIIQAVPHQNPHLQRAMTAKNG